MGYCPVHLPLFLGIPGLYPLHASGTLPPSPTVRPKLSADVREDKTGAQNCPLPRTTGLGLSGGPAQACPSPGVGESGGHRQSYLTVPCWIPLVLSPAFSTRIKGLPAFWLLLGFGPWGWGFCSLTPSLQGVMGCLPPLQKATAAPPGPSRFLSLIHT